MFIERTTGPEEEVGNEVNVKVEVREAISGPERSQMKKQQDPA